MQQVRQGDILLIKIGETPQQPADSTPIARQDGRIIVAEGEATGHIHAITAPDAMLYERETIRWLVAPQAFVVEHEEHAPLTLAPGVWQVVHQREYDPQAIRRVMD